LVTVLREDLDIFKQTKEPSLISKHLIACPNAP